MTGFYGSGKDGEMPSTEKIGGLVIKQFAEEDVDTPFFSRDAFQEIQSSYTMREVYGSNLEGFSAGGMIWAS